MKRVILGSCFIAASVASACAADPILVGETDAVITLSEEERDYSDYLTYAISESLVDLCIQPESGTPTSESLAEGGAGGASPTTCRGQAHSLDESVVGALVENLDALGYERVPWNEESEPDLRVLVSWQQKRSWALERPYCYPPDYFPGCVESLSSRDLTLTRASDENVVPPILIQLIDTSESTEDELKTIWTAAIDQQNAAAATLGTSFGGASASTVELLEKAVDQAFAQSPYLGGRSN